jgi:hypothetical protein
VEPARSNDDSQQKREAAHYGPSIDKDHNKMQSSAVAGSGPEGWNGASAGPPIGTEVADDDDLDDFFASIE